MARGGPPLRHRFRAEQREFSGGKQGAAKIRTDLGFDIPRDAERPSATTAAVVGSEHARAGSALAARDALLDTARHYPRETMVASSREGPHVQPAPADDDRAAVTATLLDYFEGWFEGDAARMENALHPDLAKRGVRVDDSGRGLVASMTAPEMIRWTHAGEGVAEKPDDLGIIVDVHDIDGEIATATVHSAIYLEHVHLVRTPERWQIINTLYRRVQPR